MPVVLDEQRSRMGSANRAVLLPGNLAGLLGTPKPKLLPWTFNEQTKPGPLPLSVIADASEFFQPTQPSEGDDMAKSTCPVTRAEFLRDAQPVEVTINGIPMGYWWRIRIECSNLRMDW